MKNMRKGRHSNQLKWREVFADGNVADYKEDTTQNHSCAVGKLKNRVHEMTFQKNNQHCFHLQRSTTCKDDSPFHEKNSLESRIQWNNDAEDETNHPHHYQNESRNIRSLNGDNNRFAVTKAEAMKRSSTSRRVGLSSFWMSLTITFLATTFILLTSNVDLVNSCNEAVCASIVSKCTLTQACKCELKNCTCCKECFDCLTYLYDECCSCVELCPKPNITHHEQMQSQVGNLKEPIDELFKALTEEKDIHGRWATFTYPIDLDQSWFLPKPEVADNANVYTVGKIVVDPSKEVVTVNCTVAFMSECMPLNKCRNSCHSMGASYFRWFHDGCCECIGSTCINYGIDESRCTKCTLEDDGEDESMESESEDDTENDTPTKES